MSYHAPTMGTYSCDRCGATTSACEQESVPTNWSVVRHSIEFDSELVIDHWHYCPKCTPEVGLFLRKTAAPSELLEVITSKFGDH